MKLATILFMALYLYALTYGIFLTELFRIPAPLIFCLPLIILFREKQYNFYYRNELWVLSIAVFLYYAVGISEIKSFIAYLISMVFCALYFNYFVGSNRKRFNLTVLIFYLLLTASAIIMVLNHYNSGIDGIRELIIGEQVTQSPSGIARTQFNFGYQLAALVSFSLIFTFLFHKPILIKIIVLLSCLIFIYLGMQRSVLITFFCSISLFLIFYYRLKAVLIISTVIFISFLFYNFVLINSIDASNNILTKNIDNKPEFNRTILTAENLRILADHPFGLIFYGKNWSDVIYRNQIFSSGITSHNAYLMFITYLGPFLGLGLLIVIYRKVLRLGFNALKEIRLKENALLICLCFSFLSVSINSLSHNGWLISADGPTLFLYFSILHFDKVKSEPLTQFSMEH